MRALIWLVLGAAATVLSLAHAVNPSSDPFGLWKSFPGIYKIHSGAVSDRSEATATDRMLTVHVDGKAAKEIFESIGPDFHPTCSGEKSDRDRRKKGVYCSYQKDDVNAKGGPYRCWIGVNLQTGDSVGTVSC